MRQRSYKNRLVSRGSPYSTKSWSRYGAGIATAAKTGFKAYRNFTKQNAGKSSNPGPITGESDWRSVYKRRPYPRGRRRKWVSFVRKTKSVIAKSLAPSFLVRTRTGPVTTVVGKQGWTGIHTILGGYGGTDSTDLSAIQALVGNFTPAAAVTLDPDRFTVSGYLAETQILNEGTTTVYVDCYYWRCKRNCPLTVDGIMGAFAQDLSSQVPNFPSGGSSLDVADYGVTPFQTQGIFPKSVQIWKKTRMKLSPGGTAQLETRSGKNYYRNREYDKYFSLIAGVTHGIMFCQYGVPTAGGVSATSLRYLTNVNYTYRVQQVSTSTGGTTSA